MVVTQLRSCAVRPTTLVLALLLAAPAAAGAEPPSFPHLHSGERALRLFLETENLGPLRKRAAEIGGAEIRRERERTALLKASGRSTAATNPSWVSLGPSYRAIARGTGATRATP
jgi:hypothetical protein